MNRKPAVFTVLVLALMVLSGCSVSLNTGSTPTADIGPAASAPSGPTPTVVGSAAPANVSAPVTLPETGGPWSALESDLEQIYAQVSPSVVSIDVISQASGQGTSGFDPFGNQQGQTQEALGSGFIWDTQGHIVTNNHVVAGATDISVTFADGTTVAAKVVGTDVNSDLAVIQVQAPASEIKPVQVADSTQLKVGQIVVAIGNPFGEQQSMSMGIVSALGRSLPSQATTSSAGTYIIPDVIQTDTAINPGNSGGVLVNEAGQLVGVTAAIESASQSNSGVGFAIPSAIVKQVVPALISTGHYDTPYLGISGTSLTPPVAQAMNLNPNQRGVLVIDVTPGSPAEQAGLQGGTQQTTISGVPAVIGGDVIVAIDGQTMNSFDQMVAYLARNTKVGQKVTLTVLRNGKEQTLTLTLGARPVSPNG